MLHLVTGTFPGTNTQISSKKHVEQSWDLVRDVKTETFADDNVPGSAKSLVKTFFDHLSGLEDI